MFRGSYVALITPFLEDESVDYETLEELIEYHINHKTSGIVILGTTGEASTISDEEKLAIVDFVVNKAKGRIHIMAGISSNDTKKQIYYAREYERLGVDSLLSINPYYNKTNEEGMYNHFLQIASSTSLDIILYNVPSRTGQEIPLSVVEKLAKIKNIKGIKEASGNMSYMASLAYLINDDFSVLSGNDDLVVPICSMGGTGVISVLANIAPETVAKMVDACLEGDYQLAREIQIDNLDLIHHLFSETNPIPIKEAMNYLEMASNNYRLPLYKMSLAKAKALHEVIDKKGELK